jgi:hypothetical protein
MPSCPDELPQSLGLSVRNIRTLVGYASLYEFEDFLQGFGAANLIEIENYEAIERSRKVFKAFKKLDNSGNIGGFFSHFFIPGKSQFHLDRDYNIFLPTFNSPFELFCLNAVQGWRDRSRYAACYINEVWEAQLKDCDYLVELLKDFDHIFVGLHHSVDSVRRLTGKPCTYLPIGVDALKFCPYSSRNLSRSIDVLNIGRRSQVTHQALLDMVAQKDIFYYYDTVSTQDVSNASKQNTFHVKNPQEHRLLLSKLLKMSRYFITNRAVANEPQRTGGKSEIPARFFEGSAAGTVMLGDAPDTEIFAEYFDWEDAVIRIPFDAYYIAEVIAELDAQPERVDAIRRNNAINALLKHDWLHRLQVIYQTFDLAPSAAMEQRSAQISALVDQIQQSTAALSVYA